MNRTRQLLERLLSRSVTDHLVTFRRQVRSNWRLHRMHRLGCLKASTFLDQNPLQLHLGCGNIYKAGWVNIDAYFTPPCTPDLTLDLRQSLPFPAGTCAEVYSEHFFEPIPYPEGAVSNLRETWRVLHPGGRVSIGVPDPIPVITAYLAGTPSPYFDYFHNHFSVRRHLNTPMEALNWLFRQGGEHQFIYDFPSLEKMLRDAGFERIVRREFDPARDSESRQHETLYVDAYKPR